MYGVSPSSTRPCGARATMRAQIGCSGNSLSLAHEPNANVAAFASSGSAVVHGAVAANTVRSPQVMRTVNAVAGGSPAIVKCSVKSCSAAALAFAVAIAPSATFVSCSANSPAALARAHTCSDVGSTWPRNGPCVSVGTSCATAATANASHGSRVFMRGEQRALRATRAAWRRAGCRRWRDSSTAAARTAAHAPHPRAPAARGA